MTDMCRIVPICPFLFTHTFTSPHYLPPCTCIHRNGVFLPTEQDCFPAFLSRLSRVHSLFTLPHPLSKTGNQVTPQQTEDDWCTSVQDANSVISIQSFHKKFLEYLVENRFYSLMYHYLDSYG